MKHSLTKLRPHLMMAALLAASMALPTKAAVIISEVLYDAPPSTTDDALEWVELYNTGCEAVDLSTYTLQDNSTTTIVTLTGLIIQPGAYVTVARDTDAFKTLYGQDPSWKGMILQFGNSGDYLTLKNNGIAVDFVAWEGGASKAPKPYEDWPIAAENVSIYRTNTTQPATNSDWAASVADTPGTGELIQDECTAISSSSSSSESSSSSSELAVSSSSIASSVSSSTASSTSSASSSLAPVDYSYETYYAPAIGMLGSELKSALHNIIKSGHKQLTYTPEVWNALQYTDEDPTNTANIITLYSGRSIDKNDRDGQPGSGENSWNREHVWAKSYGFDNQNKYGYTDIHHLRPEDRSVNTSRRNKPFDNGGNPQGEAPDTFTDSDSWEPRDSVKGDVARMLFYMDVRYDGTDGNMPDLELKDNVDMVSGDPNIGKLCVLMQWNHEDPVDDFEMRRNNRIQQLQGNRNPFIDNPDWADSLWGYACGTASSSEGSSQSSAAVSSSSASSVSSSVASSSSSSSVIASSVSSASSSSKSSGGGSGSASVNLLLLLTGLLFVSRIGMKRRV